MKRISGRITAHIRIKKVLAAIIMSAPLFCLTGLGIETVQAQDLAETYRRALETSPALMGTSALLDADRAFRKIALSALMPRVRGSAAVDRDRAHIEGFGDDFSSPLVGAAFGDIRDSYYGGAYSVTLAQPLLNGQAWSGLDAANHQVRAGEAAVKAAEQELILRVVEGYFQVLQAQAAERVATGQQKLLSEILELAKARLKVGSGDAISLKEARARYDAETSASVSAGNATRIAVQRLRVLTHCPVEELSGLGPIEPMGPKPDEVEQWIAWAEKNHPKLQQARARLDAAQKEAEMELRGRWPSLWLTAGYGYSKGDFMPSVESRKAKVGISLAVPIYEGGEISARTARAEAKVDAERYRLKEIEDGIELEVRSAFLNLENSVSRLKAARVAVESAETSLAATKKGYEIGARSIIDLLASTQEYETAKLDYYRALYDHVVARARLKWAAGVIGPADVAAINGLLAKE